MTVLTSNTKPFIVEPAEPQVIDDGGYGTPASSDQTIGIDQQGVRSVHIELPGGRRIDITDEAHDLTYDTAMLGGFADASLRLPRAFAIDHPEIREFADLVVRHGSQVRYCGRIEQIDRHRSDRDWIPLQAYGWQVHASDRPYRGLRIDRSLSRWMPLVRGDATHRDTPSDGIRAAILRRQRGVHGPELFVANPSTTDDARAGERAGWHYAVPATWSGGIERLEFRWRASGASSVRSVRVISAARPGGVWTLTTHYEQDWTANRTTSVTIDDFPDGTRDVWIYPLYLDEAVGSLNAANIRVFGPDDDGPLVYVGVQSSRASVIVKAVTDAVCPRFETSGVSATRVTIGSLDFTEPRMPVDIFNEMLLYGPSGIEDPEWTWGVWERIESGDAARYRMTMGPVSSRIDYALRGAEPQLQRDAAGLANRCVVQYVDSSGFLHEVVRTRAVADLTDAGLTREIALGPYEGITFGQARRIADLHLWVASKPRRAGSVTIEGDEMRDATTRAPVPFDAVLPGRRILIEDAGTYEVAANPLLDPRVFLITRVSVDVDAGVATLTLDNPLERLEEMIDLISQPRRR